MANKAHSFLEGEMWSGTQFPFLYQRRNIQWDTKLTPWKERCELAQNFHFFIKGEMFNCTQFSLLLGKRCELAPNFHFFINREMSNCTPFSLLLRRRDVKWHTISISLSQQRFQWQTKLAPSWKERCEVAHNFNFFIKAKMLNFTHCSLLLEGEMWTGTQFPFLYQSRDVQWQTILTPA